MLGTLPSVLKCRTRLEICRGLSSSIALSSSTVILLTSLYGLSRALQREIIVTVAGWLSAKLLPMCLHGVMFLRLVAQPKLEDVPQTIIMAAGAFQLAVPSFAGGSQ